MFYRVPFIMLCALLTVAVAACSDQGTIAPVTTSKPANSAAGPAQPSPGQQSAGRRTPAQNLTAADIAKIKWLEGSYRGTGADKPFFNRYHFNGTTLYVQSFDDEAMTKQTKSAVYELKDGMFANPSGDNRFAASEITDDLIQFVILTDASAAYRLERQGDGSIRATLESTRPDGKSDQNSYVLERLKK
jgi:hypothetical protein